MVRPGLILRMALITLLLIACSARKKTVLGESKNWKVTALSAVKTMDLQPGWQQIPISDPNNCVLIVELRITYVGPSGEVAAPSAAVMDEKDNKFEAWGNLMVFGSDSRASDNMPWLLSATHPVPDKKKLTSGESINDRPLSYYFEAPRQREKLRLAFDDIPAFALEVQELQK